MPGTQQRFGETLLFYNIIFILQTIYGLTPGVKKEENTVITENEPEIFKKLVTCPKID